jgi:CubicO group peptidase (beta-lactamase class C family)
MRDPGSFSHSVLLRLAVVFMAAARMVCAQTYDFSAATAQFQDNLTLYGSRVIAIIEQGDRGEIFRFQAGLIGPNTKAGIASCTKWLSGAVVLICAERGYFRLDDPIGQYLPIIDTYAKGDITIRQCFAMKSGLHLESPDYEIDRTLTLAQSVDLIAQNTPVIFPPGTQLDYEGDGMQVVGRICEVVTGKDWGTLAREVLFDPLGMTTADYLYFDPNPAIAGGARCSAEDYLKFLHMLMSNGLSATGTPVMSSRSVQEFFTNQTLGLPENYSPWPPSLYYAYLQRPDYGMGSWILAQNPTTAVVEEVASPGAFGTFPWVDRKRDLRGIIFIFQANGFSTTVQNNLRVLSQVRTEIDAKGLPPLPPQNPLALSRTADFLKLDWQGGALETSPDLQTWTALPWASGTFLEQLKPAPSPQLFYRLRVEP